MDVTRFARLQAPVLASVGTYAGLAAVTSSGLLAAGAALMAGAAVGAARPSVPDGAAPPDHPAAVTAAAVPVDAVVEVDVDALVQRMSGSSEGAVQESDRLSCASTDVAVRFRSVSQAVDSLRTAIDDIAGGARDATAYADSALQRSTEAGERVEALRDASQEIGQVTGLITAITGQTRMLALNATIEAARAGAAGRGFSVVADEVKNLATATAEAAERIAEHVQAVQASTSAAAAAIEDINDTLREMTAVQGGVTSAVGRQTEAAGQIAADVGEASRASDVIAELVEQRAGSLRSAYVEQAVEVAEAMLHNHGGLVLGDTSVQWRAKDQFSGQVRSVALPQLLVGDRPVLRNDDPSRPSVLVDEIRDLVGGTVTLFQRIDEQGAMLRVATNVLDAEGRRAVGTYQPVVKPDGTANPVLVEVLAGRTFSGEARILDDTYFTAYAPVRDAAGRIAGAVFVGLRKD